MNVVMETERSQTVRMAGARPTPTTVRDWTGFCEGVREVFLTIAATIAIGFAWAAVEMGQLAEEPMDVAASSFETGYDDAAWTGQ